MQGFSADQPALICRQLVKHFKDVRAVDGIDLAIRRGECFGLLGPNGAGKTTTVEILEGLQKPDAGDVEVLGHRWGGRHDRALRQRLGVQLQETRLAEKLTVTETIRLFRSFYTRGREVDELLDELDLREKAHARVGKLSGGQKQRLTLACTLAGDPELLFLDEPTTGLDPQVRRHIWQLITRFTERGGTVLLTTHYMEEAARLCGRLAIMDHGRIIARGTPDELVASLGADQIMELETSRPLAREFWDALPGLRNVSPHQDSWRLVVTGMDEVLPALLAALSGQGATVRRLVTHQPTLEDLFIHLTGRELRDA